MVYPSLQLIGRAHDSRLQSDGNASCPDPPNCEVAYKEFRLLPLISEMHAAARGAVFSDLDRVMFFLPLLYRSPAHVLHLMNWHPHVK